MLHPLDFLEELLGQDRDVRPLEASRGEDVDDLAVGDDRPGDELLNRGLEVDVLALAVSPLGQLGLDGLEVGDLVSDAPCEVRSGAEGEGLG